MSGRNLTGCDGSGFISVGGGDKMWGMWESHGWETKRTDGSGRRAPPAHPLDHSSTVEMLRCVFRVCTKRERRNALPSLGPSGVRGPSGIAVVRPVAANVPGNSRK